MAITPYQMQTDPLERFVEAFLAPAPAARTGAPGLMRNAATDVLESEDEILVVTELPGFEPEDVEIDLENNVLTLHGEKKERREEGNEQSTWHLVERRYGRFSRSFVLPREIEQDGIQARFRNGVLTGSIPKTERAKRRRIEIAGEGGETKKLTPRRQQSDEE
jgi:HSP20 family protein